MMTTPSPPDAADDPERRARRRRAAKLMGDLLPDATNDERGLEPDSRDAEILRDRPPHHDRG